MGHPSSGEILELTDEQWHEALDLVVLAHLSMFLNLFTGFLGPVAALIIWLLYKDRSSSVAFNALCSRCGTR